MSNLNVLPCNETAISTRAGRINDAAKTAQIVERVNGIEPSYAAWEAAVLPLNYTRMRADFTWVANITQ